VGSNDLRRLPSDGPSGFAETVQSSVPPILQDALPAPAADAVEDTDIGLDLGTSAAASVAEQPTLSHIGRYALKSLLGEGGLGRVYEAWDPLLSRTVAVKTLQFDLDMPSRVALDRLLLNEARAAANLNHPHIVTMYDAGLSAHGVYIAMERLRGKDLRQMLSGGWRPTPAQATQIVRRVADALAYAHARGVVHCDIKPGNIFLTRKDKPKVLDFGIARVAHASALPSNDMAIAGSPHYLAPEQLDSGVIDARTDLFALGTVLYELLTGRKAFAGRTLEEIHAAVRAGNATPVHEIQPEVPAELSAIVGRAMSGDPAQRPASAAEFSQALRTWATPDSGSETPPPSPANEIPRNAKLGAAWAVAALLATGAMLYANLRVGAESPVVANAGDPATPAMPALTMPAALRPVLPAEPTVAVAAPAKAADPDSKPRATKPAAKAESQAAKDAASAKRRTAASAAAPAAALTTGTLQIAVTPWGELEVDGRAVGTTPPLSRLTLPEGSHKITIRNADFPPYTTTVQVSGDRPAVVRHRFGS
jgi:serine/threonine-protein kinase